MRVSGIIILPATSSDGSRYGTYSGPAILPQAKSAASTPASCAIGPTRSTNCAWPFVRRPLLALGFGSTSLSSEASPSLALALSRNEACCGSAGAMSTCKAAAAGKSSVSSSSTSAKSTAVESTAGAGVTSFGLPPRRLRRMGVGFFGALIYCAWPFCDPGCLCASPGPREGLRSHLPPVPLSLPPARQRLQQRQRQQRGLPLPAQIGGC